MADNTNHDGNGAGEQEELPLGETEVPLLRVSPGMAVSSEHLEKLSGVTPEVVDGIGPMEVWASFGLVYRAGPQGAFKKKRVGWDEARRLQELVREVGWGEDAVERREAIESIAALPNGDILSAAEALAEVDSESRAAIAARCWEVTKSLSQGLTLVNAVGAAAQVRNDDVRAPREVIEMALWLMGKSGDPGENDFLGWVLGHEEGEEGLTGVVAACDDIYKEITGSRPSSTLQSRADRASALRFRIAVTDSTPKTPALVGGYEEGAVAEEESAVDERLAEDTFAATEPSVPLVEEPVFQPEVGDGSLEDAENVEEYTNELDLMPDSSLAVPDASPSGEPVAQNVADEMGLQENVAPLVGEGDLESRVAAMEVQLGRIAQDLDALMLEPHRSPAAGTGKLVSMGLAVGVLLGVIFFVSNGGDDDAQNQPEATAPRVTESYASKNFGETEVSEEATTVEDENGTEAEQPNVVEPGESLGGDGPASIDKGEVEAQEDPPGELEEAEAGEPLPEEVLPEPSEGMAEAAEPEEEVARDDSILEDEGSPEPAEEKVIAEEALSEDAATKEEAAVPVAEERVAERFGLGFKATHRLTKRTKLYRYGDRDFVEVTDLPGGDALVDECIVAKAPRSRFRHKIYKGYQTIYLSCAGEMKVICERLGCKPQQRCVTAAGWVKPCKKKK